MDGRHAGCTVGPAVFCKGVKIENFRCLRKVEFDLAPFTVLVGANGSGKTSILRAFDWERLVEENRSHGSDGPMTVAYRKDDGVWRTNTHTISRLNGTGSRNLEARPDVLLLQLTLEALRRPNQVYSAATLETDGGNLPNLLASLGRKKLGSLAEQFCKLVPLYQDVDVRPFEQGQHHVVIQDRWHADLWYTPQGVSDGTLIMLALLAACHMPKPPDILAVDELERGLHPYLLERIVQLCRQLSLGEFGRPVQILAATHSPTLLDFLNPTEVRFVSRDRSDGGSVVTSAPTETPEWERAYRAYRDSLGDIWLTGALGGVVGR